MTAVEVIAVAFFPQCGKEEYVAPSGKIHVKSTPILLKLSL